jgi:serine protease Do
MSVPAAANDLDAVQQEALREAVAKIAASVVQIETVGGSDEIEGLAVGTGPTTGLVIDAEGYIVSSSINFAHSPSGILVRFPDGKRHPAQLVATDHNRKIALLKVDLETPLPAPIFAQSDKARVGQWAIAVGRAFDAERPNVAVGIVSALGRVWGKALQTDAAVSPNNYGGPLIDLRGEVIGLLVPMSPMSDEEVAGVEWYDSGIGFAVPSNLLLQAVNRLKAGKDLHPGRLGVTFEKSVAMSEPPVVTTVHPNSPAEKAGLKKGDRIVRIGTNNVTRSAEVRYELAARYAGDAFEMLVRRGEETVKCQATLVANLEPYRCPVLGILPERGKVQDAGVLVRLAVPGSPAASAGIVPGDRIVSVDGEPVTDAADLRGRIARRKPSDKITLGIAGGGNQRNVDLALADHATTLPEGLPLPSVNPDAAPGREIPLNLPQWKNKVVAYLPKAYAAERQHGLLVWMRCVTDDQGGLELWKKHADSRGLIVVLVDPSSSERWLPGETELIGDVLALCKKKFSLDSNRVVVGGQAGGGALAYRIAARERDELRGCVVFDARLSGPQIFDQPENRFGLLIGRSDKGTLAERLDRAVGLLRTGGLPVVVLPRDGAADRLNGSDVAAMTRWIDLLDQI